jgi:hypothetical protein
MDRGANRTAVPKTGGKSFDRVSEKDESLGTRTKMPSGRSVQKMTTRKLRLSGKNKNFGRWQNEYCTAAAESKTTHAEMGIKEASAPLYGGNENPDDGENEIRK